MPQESDTGSSDMMKDLLILTVFPGAMICAAVTELFTMTLPNRLTFAKFAGFFAVAT
jgi:Flp pilus assembly protein protease CpaA